MAQLQNIIVCVFQLRDLRGLFVKFDSDGNGELDVDEMKLLIDQLKIVATTDDLKVSIQNALNNALELYSSRFTNI